MLTTTLITPERSFPSPVRYVRIRDRMVIDAALRDKIQKKGADAVVLIAREIVHAPGIDLVLPSGFVTIVATRYDGRGGAIDVSGAKGDEGVVGSRGTRGSTNNANPPTIIVPGGPGGPGKTGAAGMAGGNIRLLAEQLGEVVLRANGGRGGTGGAGGHGGDGDPGVQQNQHHDDRAGSAGGAGGAAGNGGAGGMAGTIEVEFTAAGVPQSMTTEMTPGAGGVAGAPGIGGRSGVGVAGPPLGARGAAGKPGAAGKAGTPVIEPVGVTGFRKMVKAVLGSTTFADWVAYRIAVGVYRYRCYKPSPNNEKVNQEPRRDQLKLAIAEFDAVLRLVPDNSDALRYNHQVELNQNVLGYSANFDLLPDFTQYIADYDRLNNTIGNFFDRAIRNLLEAAHQDNVKAQLDLNQIALADRISVISTDRAAADAGSKAAGKVRDHAAKRLTDLNAQIAAASAKAPDESITIGTIVSTVSLVTVAVVSVVGAVYTAGASLSALAPAIAELSVVLSDVGGSIFAATDKDIAKVKEQYKEVGKDYDQVMKSSKEAVTATVNFVTAIENLSTAKSTNTEVVGLMRQGVELAYELLVATLHGQQAELIVKARDAEGAAAVAMQDLTKNQIIQATLNEEMLRNSGRSAVRATQKSIDTMLSAAFKAQRAVEIYTLKDPLDRVSFDSGFVHPDIEADFDEASADVVAAGANPKISKDDKLAVDNAMEFEIIRLVSAYTTSWQQFLGPVELLTDFNSYFTDEVKRFFVDSQVVMPITDRASLDAFKDRSGEASRVSVLIDRSDLVADEFETKIVDVRVALVGATLTNPGLSCDVIHGGVYLSKLRDGTDRVQPLTEQLQRDLPRLLAFDQNDPPVFTGQGNSGLIHTKNLWGRGVAGTWEVEISEVALRHCGADLTGLTAIQLWISTQSFVGK